jgi:hypothetical protein
MTTEEFDKAIIEKLLREPFVPFAVEGLDGTVHEFHKPMSISIRAGFGDCVGIDHTGKIVFMYANQTRSIHDLATASA